MAATARVTKPAGEPNPPCRSKSGQTASRASGVAADGETGKAVEGGLERGQHHRRDESA